MKRIMFPAIVMTCCLLGCAGPSGQEGAGDGVPDTDYTTVDSAGFTVPSDGIFLESVDGIPAPVYALEAESEAH